MKFGHVLKDFAEEERGEDARSEGGRDFLSYKKLKKLLKQAAAEGETQHLPAAQPAGEDPSGAQTKQAARAGPTTQGEREFMALLNQDLENINTYFIEAEEDAVIRLQSLEERLAPGGAAETDALRAQMVDFHGQMVLLLHWSLVNYAGVAKILKKHDKLLGSVGRPLHPYLANVLQQPFTSTEGISRLVRAAEAHVQRLSGGARDAGGAGRGDEGQGGGGGAAHEGPNEAALVKRTRAALGMLTRLRETAHTPSTLLPAAPDVAPAKKPRAEGEAAGPAAVAAVDATP